MTKKWILTKVSIKNFKSIAGEKCESSGQNDTYTLYFINEYLHCSTICSLFDKIVLSFSVQQGFTILTGPNGSGKSNILEAISKLFMTECK
jgi:AAA15 family ATPase/GTPase